MRSRIGLTINNNHNTHSPTVLQSYSLMVVVEVSQYPYDAITPAMPAHALYISDESFAGARLFPVTMTPKCRSSANVLVKSMMTGSPVARLKMTIVSFCTAQGAPSSPRKSTGSQHKSSFLPLDVTHTIWSEPSYCMPPSVDDGPNVVYSSDMRS
jgi:hypothetical protein